MPRRTINQRCRSHQFPDLSGLDLKLADNLVLNMTVAGRAFPVTEGRGMVTAFVRTTESACRCYERARQLIERSVTDDSLAAFIESMGEFEICITALHRAMRIAETLKDSELTSVKGRQLPSDSHRDDLRRMRNAIDHLDGPIRGGYFGTGASLFLFVTDTDIEIDEVDEEGNAVTVVATHTELGKWVLQLHSLATEITRDPEAFARLTCA
jgi:hypothetical protein